MPLRTLVFDISFKTVHYAKVKLRSLKVRWFYTGHFEKMELKGFTLLDFCNLKGDLKSYIYIYIYIYIS